MKLNEHLDALIELSEKVHLPWEFFDGEILDAEGIPIMQNPRGDLPFDEAFEFTAKASTSLPALARALKKAIEEIGPCICDRQHQYTCTMCEVSLVICKELGVEG